MRTIKRPLNLTTTHNTLSSSSIITVLLVVVASVNTASSSAAAGGNGCSLDNFSESGVMVTSFNLLFTAGELSEGEEISLYLTGSGRTALPRCSLMAASFLSTLMCRGEVNSQSSDDEMSLYKCST